jgi:hypothetical protein
MAREKQAQGFAAAVKKVKTSPRICRCCQESRRRCMGAR